MRSHGIVILIDFCIVLNILNGVHFSSNEKIDILIKMGKVGLNSILKRVGSVCT